MVNCETTGTTVSRGSCISQVVFLITICAMTANCVGWVRAGSEGFSGCAVSNGVRYPGILADFKFGTLARWLCRTERAARREWKWARLVSCRVDFVLHNIKANNHLSAQEHAGEKWTDILGWTQGEVEIGEDGWAEFTCPGESLGVWALEQAKGREEFGK